MNELFGEEIKFRLGYLILFLLFILECILLYLYFSEKLSSTYTVLIGGISASLIVAIIQLVISAIEYKRIERLNKEIIKFKKLGVLRILENRDDEAHYREKIQSTNCKLIVYGHTSRRLIEDFADINSQRSEKKVLLEAMNRGVVVKILIASNENNNISETEKLKFEHTRNAMSSIKEKYKDNFFVKYYNHKPMHSIFSFDNECFIGPMFEGLPSRDTPTLHMKSDSNFAKKYFDHFDKEWISAKELELNE